MVNKPERTLLFALAGPNSLKSKNGILAGSWLIPSADRDSHLEENKFEILEYHWDDRSKLREDMKYIRRAIEDFQLRISAEMNRLHKVDYPVKFWKVLLSEWLYLVVQISYDRNEVIEYAKSRFNVSVSESGDGETLGPAADISEFITQIRSIDWNSKFMHLIFSSNNQDFYAKQYVPQNQSRDNKAKKRKIPTINISIKELITIVSIKLNQLSPRVMLSGTYLSKSELIQLSLLLKTIPIIDLPKVQLIDYEKISRSQIKLERQGDDDFYLLLSRIIPLLIPASYLEGFKSYEKYSIEIFGKKSPKAIVTANDYSSNETWKFWVSRSVVNGAKLIVLQHGGLDGINRDSLFQDFEIGISDAYFTWGWSDINNPKVIAAPASKLIKLDKMREDTKKTANSHMLLVTLEMPLTSSWMASMPMGPQVDDAVDIGYSLASAMGEEFKKNVSVRTYPQDFGLNQRNKFREILGSECISNPSLSFYEALIGSRLVVSTYNATTFIESMKLNIPTIMCWNPTMWELTIEGEEIMNRFLDCNVLFYDPEKCTEFIQSHWNNLEDWWFSAEVQANVDKFLKSYGNTGTKPLKELKRKIMLVQKP